MFKKLQSISFVAVIFLGISCAASATTINNPSIKSIREPHLSAKAYMLVDYYSDEVLASKDIDRIVEPASLTKIMTMYVIDHELKNGTLHLDDKVKISKKAWKVEGSRMFLEVGSRVPVEEIIKGIIISSANDGSIALAEHIAGSETAFVDLMNSYAGLLGMKNTNFVNATGLPHRDHYTTARDMSLLAKAIIRDFPETYSLYSEKTHTHLGIKQFNRNRLLWRNRAVDGIKTGHTDSAGFCLVASAKKDDMRLISVVIGAKSDETRTVESSKLLNWGFRFFETQKIYSKGQILKELPIWMGQKNVLTAGLESDLYITVRKGIYKDLDAVIVTDDIIKAPKKQGDTVGSFNINYKGEPVTTKEIIALETVESGGIFTKASDYVKLTFKSLMKKFDL